MPDYPVKNGAGADIVTGYDVDANPPTKRDYSGDYPVKNGLGQTIIASPPANTRTLPTRTDGARVVSRYPVKDALGQSIVSGAYSGSEYDPITALGTDLVGYFDARRGDTITRSVGGVSEWRCAKTGYAAQQALGTAQPIYSPTSFNGDAGVAFDGVDDCLSGLSHPYPLSLFEVWMLLSQAAPGSDATQRFAFGMGNGSANGATINRVQLSGVGRIRGTVGNGTSAVISANNAVDFSSRHCARLIVSATGVIQEIDGNTVAEAAAVPSLTNARFRLGAFINSVPSSFHSGQVAAVLITNLLSVGKADSLRPWLMSRRNV